MDNVSIEKPRFKDFLEIAELDRGAWAHNANSEYVPDGEHAWRLWVEHALVYKAMVNDEIIGAILAFPSFKDNTYCFHKVFVKQGYRNKGIGKALLNVLLVDIDKLKANVFLTVDPANKHAIKLYETWGFTDKQFVKGYYRDCEDRYVLTRKAR